MAKGEGLHSKDSDKEFNTNQWKCYRADDNVQMYGYDKLYIATWNSLRNKSKRLSPPGATPTLPCQKRNKLSGGTMGRHLSTSEFQTVSTESPFAEGVTQSTQVADAVSK